MTAYQTHGVKLSEGQKKKLAKAINDRSEITLRFSRNELTGNDKLMLTKTQIGRIRKATKQNKGLDLKVSKTQIRHMAKTGGSLITTLMSLGTRALPYASRFASTVLPGLAQGALSSLGNFSMDKILGQGQVGGYLIPQKKIKKLAPLIGLFTNKQIKDIANAIKTGKHVIIKPTKKQQKGGAIGLLASIGIPLLLNSILGKGLQNRPRPKGKGLQNRPRPKAKKGKGLQNRPASDQYLAPYFPPPFIGQWGDGVKKKTKGDGLILGPNSPFKNIPLLGQIL